MNSGTKGTDNFFEGPKRVKNSILAVNNGWKHPKTRHTMPFLDPLVMLIYRSAKIPFSLVLKFRFWVPSSAPSVQV